MKIPKLQLGLKVKFVLIISFMILFTSIILSGFLIQKQSNLIQSEMEKRGRSLVKNLAYNSEYGVLIENEKLLATLIEGLMREEDVTYALIYNREGKILSQMDHRKLHIKKDLDQEIISVALQEEGFFGEYHFTQEGEYGFYDLAYTIKTTKVEMPKEELGVIFDKDMDLKRLEKKIGVARIGLSLVTMRKEMARMKSIVVLLTALVVAIAILLTFALVNLIIKPVDKLVGATERIAKGDLSQVVQVDRKDEIGKLAQAFNQMTTSLKESRKQIEDYSRNLEKKVEERTKELKEAQALLIQTEKMAAVGQLAAGVAHELNNPLGGILGYSQFAIEKISSKTPQDLTSDDVSTYTQYLKDIECQSQRCKTIVQNLLKFARASVEDSFEPLDLNLVVQDTLVFTKHQLDMAKVKLVLELADSLPPIMGSSNQLQQVCTNVILNALHAMPQGGELRIVTGVEERESKKVALIEFTDTGYGINQENLRKIFEPFYTTKKPGEGTGLGLSVSYGIIRDHNGEILAKSEIGKGTTFRVLLPVAETQKNQKIHDKIKEIAVPESGR
ncbi:MAG: ATP-binding protein [Candidatus Zixiibacteriota bacterium]